MARVANLRVAGSERGRPWHTTTEGVHCMQHAGGFDLGVGCCRRHLDQPWLSEAVRRESSSAATEAERDEGGDGC